jgi:hypothetical protein
MVKRYSDDALLEAAERADQLLDEGDMAGAETWHSLAVSCDAFTGAPSGTPTPRSPHHCAWARRTRRAELSS